MAYTPSKTLTFEEFLAQYGNDPRHELVDAELLCRLAEDKYPKQRCSLGMEIDSTLFPDLKLKLDDVMP